MAMLELKHICQSYKKGKPVLRDISFTIPAGQFVSVIGPSGAGKTTLLRLFNHMVCPDSGEVWIDEVRFDTLKSRKRRTIQQRVGMISKISVLSIRVRVCRMCSMAAWPGFRSGGPCQVSSLGWKRKSAGGIGSCGNGRIQPDAGSCPEWRTETACSYCPDADAGCYDSPGR